MKVDISNSVCYVKIVKEMKKGITENGSAFYFMNDIYTGKGEIMMEKALIYSLIGVFWVCTWFTGCSTKLEGMLTVVEIKNGDA